MFDFLRHYLFCNNFIKKYLINCNNTMRIYIPIYFCHVNIYKQVAKCTPVDSPFNKLKFMSDRDNYYLFRFCKYPYIKINTNPIQGQLINMTHGGVTYLFSDFAYFCLHEWIAFTIKISMHILDLLLLLMYYILLTVVDMINNCNISTLW